MDGTLSHVCIEIFTLMAFIASKAAYYAVVAAAGWFLLFLGIFLLPVSTVAASAWFCVKVAFIKSTGMTRASNIPSEVQPISAALMLASCINSPANVLTARSCTARPARPFASMKPLDKPAAAPLKEPTPAMMQLHPDAAAVVGRAGVSKEEAEKIRAAGLAKHCEQLAQHQKNLADADAAARKAATGPGLACLGSFYEDGTYYYDSDPMACPEPPVVQHQQAVAVSTVAAPKADADANPEESLAKDFDGIKDADWQALLADPAWAARVAALQGVTRKEG